MSTLIILVFSFGLFWFLNKYALRRFRFDELGRSALAVMLLFTGTSHFYKTDEMVQMMPELLPNKVQLVYFTGVLEIAGAVGLIIKRFTKWTSIALILFFLAILPANIIGSIKKVELGGMEKGASYLYFRIPLQLLFMAWTYYFGVYVPEQQPKRKLQSNTNT